jgi:fucose 4-O-acetylase-like acetyltransferase
VTGSRQPASVSRDPYWDNVRFVAIALVVVGHTIANFDSGSAMAATYFVIYAFHMPLFAFVSGLFAKAGPVTRDNAFTTVRQLVVPYLVFTVIWFGVRYLAEGRARLDFGSPYSLLWFLLALTVWRMLLPYLAALRYPVLISLVIACVAGYLQSVGPTFDSGKVLGMLPFFVLGWAARQRGWTSPAVLGRLAAPAVRLGSAAVLLATLVSAYLAIGQVRDLALRDWARMASNYVELGRPEWWAFAVRLGMFALAVVLATCVLSLVPRRRSRISAWGARTMYVYLLHLFPLYLLGEVTDVYEWFDSLPRFALGVLAALAWTVLLSSGVVRRVFRPIVEPRLTWLRAPEPGGPPGTVGPGQLPATAGPIDRTAERTSS